MAEIATTAIGSPEAHPRAPEAELEEGEEDRKVEEEDDAGDSLKRKAEEGQSPDDRDGERTPKRARADESHDTSRRNGGAGPSDGQRGSAPGSPVEEAKRDVRRPSASETDRQRGVSTEEKKRGKRLFGGLLNTLSQTTGKSQQKKRLEIERRQQDRAHQQKVEDDKRRAEKLAKLDEIRRTEQIRLDEEVMHRRHSQLLDRARCLRTRSAPRIYYRPWEPTDEEGRIIKDQIQDAEDQIGREVQDFKRRREKRLRDLGVSFRPSSHTDSTTGEPPRERSNGSQAESSHRHAAKVVHERDHEERDDMVETEEDTVIY